MVGSCPDGSDGSPGSEAMATGSGDQESFKEVGFVLESSPWCLGDGGLTGQRLEWEVLSELLAA